MRNIVITFKKPCTYAGIEQLGFPKLGSTHLLKGSDVRDKLFNWTAQNWVYHKPIIKLLLALTDESESTPLYVSSRIARSAMQGVLDFAYKEKETIRHLETAFDGEQTVGGTKVPKFSNTLGTLDFIERQKLLRQHRERLEEVNENPHQTD